MRAIKLRKCVFIRFIFRPWGLANGLKPCKEKISNNLLLEDAYKRNRGRRLTESEVAGLAKRLDWSDHQVERWSESVDAIRQFKLSYRASLHIVYMTEF